MGNPLYDYGYGTRWTERFVYSKAAHFTSVVDFHEHDFYEINLILSGNYRILLSDQTHDDTECCVLIAKPGTRHFVSCSPDQLYSRTYLVFTQEFVADFSLEAKALLASFSESGTIIRLNGEQKQLCATLMDHIRSEKDRFRSKLLIFYLLSTLHDLKKDHATSGKGAPRYIIKALTYIDDRFSEKITAESLARSLNIGRTTLMTAFKRYTGMTLNDYLLNVRLSHAIHLLQEGRNVQETADRCGLGDSSNFIRSFKKKFGVTPRQYLQNYPEI